MTKLPPLAQLGPFRIPQQVVFRYDPFVLVAVYWHFGTLEGFWRLADRIPPEFFVQRAVWIYYSCNISNGLICR